MSRIKSHWRNKSKSAVDTEITDIPILEDDEENNEIQRPVLPNFSSTSNIHNHSKQPSDDMSPTASLGDAIPIPKPSEKRDSKGLSDSGSSDVFNSPVDSAKNIRREIDDDFDADFDRDAGVGFATGLPSTASLGSAAANVVSSAPGEVKRGTRAPKFDLGDGESSSDESTDEEAEQSIPEPLRGDNSLNRNVSNKSGETSDSNKGVSLRDRLKRRFTISGHRQGADDDIEKQVGSDVQSNDNQSSVSAAGSGPDARPSIHKHRSIFHQLLNPDVNVGMTPAAPGNGILNRHHPKPLDEEAAIESQGDYAPHIDEEQFRNEAKGIVSQHFGALNMSSSTLATDSIPAAHARNDSTAFLTNDDILNDEFDDVRRDLNLADFDVPESAFKNKRVKKGIASALMGLYNRPTSTATTIYTPSVASSGTATPVGNMDPAFDADELKSKLNKIGSVDSSSKLNVPESQV
ncbi:unnamed protein product [Ambrosiozyma monospora]|uniref:Unnamed protein product n=1 Tax=Ambrosiozyma monospora TaxID=43982 RepID=A0ACB5SW62_AMBMO|nr:unnamed protein product [Ambrosiozyma monospora]